MLSTSDCPRVPLELTLMILECLAASRDWDSLASFSCTCLNYFRPARKLLFQEISLRKWPHPAPASARDVSQRIKGLCGLLKRDPETRSYIHRFTLLDAYPVDNDTEWIIQRPELVPLIGMLTDVRHCTLGCSLGFLDGRSFPPALHSALEDLFKQPQLKILTLYNMSFPVTFLRTSALYLYANNVHPIWGASILVGVPVTGSRLRYLNMHMECLSSTYSAWEIMQIHAHNLKVVKWRCWEDARTSVNWGYLPSNVDLGQMKVLRKFALKASFGAIARDLMQVYQILANVTCASSLAVLELDVSCPVQRTWLGLEDIDRHEVWCLLGEVLRRREYSSVRRVSLVLRVHEFDVLSPEGTPSTSSVEMQKRLKHSLRNLIDASAIHFKYHVLALLPREM